MSGATNGGQERAYQALRQSEELHRATLGSISDAVFLTDDRGVFTFVCPNVNVIFGYAPDEVFALETLHRLLGSTLFDGPELAPHGEIRNVPCEVSIKSGERRHLLVHLKRVAIQGGTVLCTCRDVTELRRAERELEVARLELAHAGRLALVGQLVASVAHDLRQPLTAVIGNVELASELMAGRLDSAAIAELSRVLHSIGRAGGVAVGIVERLLETVRPRALQYRPLDLNEVVSDVLRIVAVDARRRDVALSAVLDSSVSAIEADRLSVQQVLLNLLGNAMDALDEDRSLERRVEVATSDRGSGVEVAVSDTGRGIADEHRSQLFEAFFTTKRDGVGLGLAIARSIVDAHAGRIWAEPGARGGTVFRFSLPRRRPSSIVAESVA